MKLQEKLKCTTKCITHQEGIIVGQDAALHDALAKDDAVSAADQRQVWREPALCQQDPQQAAAGGQAAHGAGEGRSVWGGSCWCCVMGRLGEVMTGMR